MSSRDNSNLFQPFFPLSKKIDIPKTLHSFLKHHPEKNSSHSSAEKNTYFLCCNEPKFSSERYHQSKFGGRWWCYWWDEGWRWKIHTKFSLVSIPKKKLFITLMCYNTKYNIYTYREKISHVMYNMIMCVSEMNGL